MAVQATYRTESVEDTQNLGRHIGAFMAASQDPICLALVGDMGAGKTHFSQGIGAGFGVEEEMTSPTFSLMNTYSVGPKVLYHFDLYRLEDTEELDTIGFYEYTEDQMALVEWADKFPEEMPEEALWIYIDKTDDRTRTFRIESSTLSRDELVAIGGSYVVGD